MNETAFGIEDLLDAPIGFTPRADPIRPQHRPERRVALCLLLIDKCWGGKATWKALHVLSWASQSAERVALLMSVRGHGDDAPDWPIVRFEPALDRALDLAVGVGFVVRDGTTFALTTAGEKALQQVRASDAFVLEKAALAMIKGKVSRAEVERILKWRTS